MTDTRGSASSERMPTTDNTLLCRSTEHPGSSCDEVEAKRVDRSDPGQVRPTSQRQAGARVQSTVACEQPPARSQRWFGTRLRLVHERHDAHIVLRAHGRGYDRVAEEAPLSQFGACRRAAAAAHLSSMISSRLPTLMGVPRRSSTLVRSSSLRASCGFRRSWFVTNSSSISK